MKLETHDDFGHARRLNQKVLVYLRETGELEGRGIIIAFDKDTVSILSDSVGVLNFLRENVSVYVEGVESS